MPAADPAARWARLAAQLCRSPAGFITTASGERRQVISHAALTRMQQVTADAAARHVVAERRPGLFAGVRPLPMPNPPASALITIAVPIVMPYAVRAVGALGVLDVTTDNHGRDIAALRTVADAYAWLTGGSE